MVTEIALHGQFASLYKKRRQWSIRRAPFIALSLRFFPQKNTSSLQLKDNKFREITAEEEKVKTISHCCLKKKKGLCERCFVFLKECLGSRFNIKLKNGAALSTRRTELKCTLSTRAAPFVVVLCEQSGIRTTAISKYFKKAL